MEAAKDSRDAALLIKPIKRAKKAVEFDAALTLTLTPNP